jgi:hypothetical protein
MNPKFLTVFERFMDGKKEMHINVCWGNKEKISFRRQKMRREENIKVDLRGIGCEDRNVKEPDSESYSSLFSVSAVLICAGPKKC